MAREGPRIDFETILALIWDSFGDIWARRSMKHVAILFDGVSGRVLEGFRSDFGAVLADLLVAKR